MKLEKRILEKRIDARVERSSPIYSKADSSTSWPVEIHYDEVRGEEGRTEKELCFDVITSCAQVGTESP